MLRPVTISRSVTRNSWPSTVAHRSTVTVSSGNALSRSAIITLSNAGTRTGGDSAASSATPASTATLPSLTRESTSSLTYKGFPPAARTSAARRGPGRAPVTCSTSPGRCPAGSGPSDRTVPPRASTSPRSLLTCSRSGSGRYVPASSSGNCPTARASRCHTSRLASSAHCRSSVTSTTGDSAQSRSTSASTRSVSASTGSPEGSGPVTACSSPAAPGSRAAPGRASRSPPRHSLISQQRNPLMEFIRRCPGQPELRARGVAEDPPQQGRLPDSLLSLDEHSTADSGGQLGEQVPQHRQLVVTASEEIALRGRPRTQAHSSRQASHYRCAHGRKPTRN